MGGYIKAREDRLLYMSSDYKREDRLMHRKPDLYTGSEADVQLDFIMETHCSSSGIVVGNSVKVRTCIVYQNNILWLHYRRRQKFLTLSRILQCG